MKTNILLVIILLTTSLAVRSQDYVFRVMANNGSNVFRTVSSDQWSPVKRGVSFNSGDVVKLVDRAYLGLIHNSGKTLELIDEGVFEIDDIALNIKSQKKGLGGKYTEFVLNSIDLENDLYEEKELVTRGAGSIMHLFLPPTSEVLNSKQIITWDNSSYEEESIFVLTVKGIFDDILLTEEVQGNEYLLDLDQPSLSDETMYAITISAKDISGSTSNEHTLDRLTGAEKAAIQEELDLLKEGMNNESSLDMLVLAHFYEENGLFSDAISSYQRAINYSPDITDFQEMFTAFKQRHNIH